MTGTQVARRRFGKPATLVLLFALVALIVGFFTSGWVAVLGLALIIASLVWGFSQFHRRRMVSAYISIGLVVIVLLVWFL